MMNQTVSSGYLRRESLIYRVYTGIRSILVYLTVFILFLTVGPVLIAYILITHDLTRPYRWVRRLLRLVFFLAGIQIDVRGLENIPDPPVMFVANHQSQIEPPAVFMILPHDVRVFPKKELFRVPILGHLMRIAGFIPVDRKNPERAKKDIARAVDMMHEGISFLIFPEGTRTRTGHVQRFKKGGFVLSIQAGVPIVPIAIEGAYELCRKGEWRLRPGRVKIQVLEPIPTKGLTIDDRDTLAQKTREVILSVLPARYRPPQDPVREQEASHGA